MLSVSALLVAHGVFGTLPQWLTVLALVALGLALRGGAIGPAVGYLREANAALERENTELKKERTELVSQVAALKARTDLTPLQTELVNEIHRHADQVTREHHSMLNVLEMIAARLGSDPANGSDPATT